MRVYRVVGRDLLPVAMVGQVGEYVDETTDQLRVAMGEGITGWVAQHRLAQNLGDAASDPRAHTIPGTEDDLDESMLLAPMVFDDQVLGVVVLSKLGLNRFTDDDLRLLVIYASFAAQAMANADSTERLRAQTITLERQLRGQRELLQITETILTKLDAREVLDAITDRIGGLIACDTIAIELLDPATETLKPLTARGMQAERHLQPREPGESGLASWVVAHNEPVYVSDERNDPRVGGCGWRRSARRQCHRRALPARTGADRRDVTRTARPGNTFSVEEFELVQLFAAQVSIALQNAEVFRGGRDPGTHRRPDWTAQPRDVREVAGPQRPRWRTLQPDHAGPRRLPRRQQRPRPPGRRRRASPDRRARSSGPDATPTSSSATAATSSRSSCPAPTPPARSWSPSGHAQAIAASARRVTASVGVATFPQDGRPRTDVLLAADRACFVAKRSGRDRVVTAIEGLALGAEVPLQEPTPVDSALQPEAPIEGAPETTVRTEAAAMSLPPRPGPTVRPSPSRVRSRRRWAWPPA